MMKPFGKLKNSAPTDLWFNLLLIKIFPAPELRLAARDLNCIWFNSFRNIIRMALVSNNPAKMTVPGQQSGPKKLSESWTDIWQRYYLQEYRSFDNWYCFLLCLRNSQTQNTLRSNF